MADAGGHRIGFGEFGVRFVHAALTAERIQARFREKVGPLDEIVKDTGQWWTTADVKGALTDVVVEELTPNDLDPDAAYVAHLKLDLMIRLTTANLVHGDYKSSFDVPCKLMVVAMTPLSLEIHPYTILGKDIDVALEGTDWYANLIDGLVRGQVSERVAEAVNEKIEAARPSMKVDMLAILAASDKPADPGAAPPPDTVVKAFAFDIANPVPLGPGESFRGELPAGARAYFKVVVDPKVVFQIEAGVRVHEGGPWTDLEWRLVDLDENLLANGGSQTAFDKENFEKLHWSLHSGERRETALLVLHSLSSTDATVRGKLNFTPFEG